MEMSVLPFSTIFVCKFCEFTILTRKHHQLNIKTNNFSCIFYYKGIHFVVFIKKKVLLFYIRFVLIFISVI